MPHFAFRATDRMGNTVDGTVEAPSETHAANQIGQMGYTLIGLGPASGESAPMGMVASAAETLHPPVSPELHAAASASRGGGIDLTQPMAPVPARTLLGGDDTGVIDTPQERQEAWQRGGPLPQAPAPQMTLSATGALLARTQPMAPQPLGAVGEPAASCQMPAASYQRPAAAAARERRPDAPRPAGRRIMEVLVYPIFSGVVIKDLAPFYRQFATLIGAGLPIYQALVALESNTANAKLKEIARAGQIHVQAGGKFSDVLARWPWVVQPVQLELIRAAEQSGMLEQALKQIAEYVEHDWEIKRIVARETLYPKIVLFVALMILGRTFLVGEGLALVRLVLGSMGRQSYSGLEYLRDTLGFGALCLLIYLIPFALFRLSLFNVKGVREVYDSIKDAIPGFGTMAKMFAVARFGRTMSALYRGGFGMSYALEVAGDASGNAVLRAAVQRAIPIVERGGLASDALRSSGFFTAMSLDMFRTGETSGRLDEMLDKMADFYEAEGKLKTRQAAMIFGTIVFLIVAILVAIAVISFYMGYGAGVTSGAGE
ncbi:MAG TPA: type II secretion system F family protein [Chthonomonadaceae bacterium]|nr:type II secretion system F family protein [Chthonomonadaceae bacterium]